MWNFTFIQTDFFKCIYFLIQRDTVLSLLKNPAWSIRHLEIWHLFCVLETDIWSEHAGKMRVD